MPDPILHLTERSLWVAARAKGTYEISTRGKTLQDEGFIHFSTRAQLPGTARFYDGLDDLVVLVVDPGRLDAPVRWEAPEPGAEAFPHVYGPIPVDAVVAV